MAAYGKDIGTVYTIDPNYPTSWLVTLSKSPATKLSKLIATSAGVLYHLGMTGSVAFTEVLDLTTGSVGPQEIFQAIQVDSAQVLMVESDIIVC